MGIVVVTEQCFSAATALTPSYLRPKPICLIIIEIIIIGQRVQLPVLRGINSGDRVYSMVVIVNTELHIWELLRE